MIPTLPPGQPLYWLGGNIDVRVQVDLGPGAGFTGIWDSDVWDSGLWGVDDLEVFWTDISEYVLSVDTNVGFQRWGERSETGSMTVVVDNTLGYFTPGGTAVAPWFRPYRPGRAVRVVAVPDVEDRESVAGGLWDTAQWDTGLWGYVNAFEDVPFEVPLFTGRLDASNDAFEEAAYAITATLQATDYMGVFARYQPVATTPTGVQLSSERVGSALDRMGWVDRDIQTGVHSVQTSDLAQSTLEECQRAADAEGGAFFASADGFAVFKSRDWLIVDDRSVTIQGYLGYDEIPAGAQSAHVIGVETTWELARTANDVQFARVGGTMQHVEDAASQLATQGPLTYQRTDLQNTTDGAVLFLADRYLDAFKDARLRIDSVTIAAVKDTADEDLNRLLWFTQLGDRLSVIVTTPYGWEVERELHVMGISHSITANDWQATFRLDDAQTIEVSYWILGDPVFGVLGETTRLV